jgi:glutathione S-transferase
MVVQVSVPEHYGYAILGSLVVPFFTSFYLGGQVMQARSKFNVPYPNLYATPGYHKQADEFNRYQRGHQSVFESWTSVTAFCLIGGLKHPLLAAAAGIIYSIGNIFFLIGYADTTLDVKMARYKRGGGLKWIGIFLSLGICISMAGSMEGWW